MEDYGACELEYHDTPLEACQQHRIVGHIFFQYTSLLAQLAVVPALASSVLARDQENPSCALCAGQSLRVSLHVFAFVQSCLLCENGWYY